jgi:hypothetical protein
MNSTRVRRLLAAAIVLGALFITLEHASSSASAQAPAASGWAYRPPPAGQPDLQGVWKVWNTARYDVEDHSARPGIPAGKGVIVDPPDGRIPYQEWALAKRKENYDTSRNPDPWKSSDPYHKCYSPGVPRLTYLGWPFQIIQTEKYVAFVYEWMHQRRFAYYDAGGRMQGVDFWNGDSRARWEGKTLVVDVTSFNDRTWFDMVGNFHSEALRVVERYTLVDNNTIDYEVRIEDPKVFTRPWTMKMPIHRQTDVGLLDYECHALLDEAGIPITWPRF